MCSHSSSATVVTENISTVLYPRIHALFPLLKRCGRETFISKEAAAFYEMIEQFKREFNSLAEFEKSQVFPAVMEVFNTKEDTSFIPSANIVKLHQEAQIKETCIKELVEDLEIEADALSLPDAHAIFKLTAFFREEYMPEKEKWYEMLQGWNRTCACFIHAASFKIPEPDKTTSLTS